MQNNTSMIRLLIIDNVDHHWNHFQTQKGIQHHSTVWPWRKPVVTPMQTTITLNPLSPKQKYTWWLYHHIWKPCQRQSTFKCLNSSIGFHIPPKNGCAFATQSFISFPKFHSCIQHFQIIYILALGIATLKIIKITSLSQYPAAPNIFSDRIWTNSTHQSPQITFNNHYSTTKKQKREKPETFLSKYHR